MFSGCGSPAQFGIEVSDPYTATGAKRTVATGEIFDESEKVFRGNRQSNDTELTSRSCLRLRSPTCCRLGYSSREGQLPCARAWC